MLRVAMKRFHRNEMNGVEEISDACQTNEHPAFHALSSYFQYGIWLDGDGEFDITEIDITESAITNFQESDITESDITEKGNGYNGI